MNTCVPTAIHPKYGINRLNNPQLTMRSEYAYNPKDMINYGGVSPPGRSSHIIGIWWNVTYYSKTKI